MHGCGVALSRSTDAGSVHLTYRPVAMLHASLTPTSTTRRAAPRAAVIADDGGHAFRSIAEIMELLRSALPIRRRLLHAGDAIYRNGERFTDLHIVHSGFFKGVTVSADGREQVVGLHFKGDWLGFDGIAQGHYDCDAIALDTGEVWSVRYASLIAASVDRPELLATMHAAMSRELACDREWMMSLCTLPVDARVAHFLRYWADALAQRGLRTDRITLRLSRAEMGNYLGMTLESVSRALSKLAKAQVIAFAEKGRRTVQIPNVDALGAYIERSLVPNAATVQ